MKNARFTCGICSYLRLYTRDLPKPFSCGCRYDIVKSGDSNVRQYNSRDGVDQVNKVFVRNKFEYLSSDQQVSWHGRLAVVARMAIACATLLYGSAALAWGFGEMRVLSALSEPLRTQVNLFGSDAATADKNCFKARLQGFDGASLGGAISVSFRENSHSLLITTRGPVNEPAAMLAVSYTCAPQMQREYAILLDLPTSQPSAPLVAPQRQENLAMPSSEAARQSAAEAKPAPKPRRAAADSNEGAVREPQASKAANRSANRNAGTTKEPAKSVLKLGDDAVDGNYVFRQRLALSYDLSAVPAVPEGVEEVAAAALEPHADLSASDRALLQLQEKMTALERRTEALQKQNAAQSLALDQARNATATSSVTYILYFLLLICLLAIGWLVWRVRQARSEVEQASWQSMVPMFDAEEDKQAQSPVIASAAEDDAQPTTQNGAASGGVGSALALFGRKMRRKSDMPERPVSPAPAQERGLPELDDPFAGMSVVVAEEILDEIQEAEFWVHMNQPQRAISILETDAQPTSPLRWLHLFDLYRMVDDKERYDSLAARFKKAFNGHVAPWERSEAEKGQRHIDEFPHVMGKIMEVWPTDGAVKFLEELLLDNREGNRQGFDLPAYQDLLFLTNIAYQVQALRAADAAGHAEHEV